MREAPPSDVKDLQQLAGHLAEGLFITKFRKIFARDEMNDDLSIVPARYGETEDIRSTRRFCPPRRHDSVSGRDNRHAAAARAQLRSGDEQNRHPPDQAKQLADAVCRQKAYLYRLRERMEKRGFKDSDPLYRKVVAAYDAVFAHVDRFALHELRNQEPRRTGGETAVGQIRRVSTKKNDGQPCPREDTIKTRRFARHRP